jgi:bacterioferritin
LDTEKNEEIVKELVVSYWMEMETIQNYLANGTNLDGLKAEEVKKALAADITEELSHAQQIAARIRVLGGEVPGSEKFKSNQNFLQPPTDSTDVVSVIRGVIEAEAGAIAQYKKLIALCDGFDFPTQDLCITLLGDEEQHKREFEGFLRGFE